MYLCLLPRNAVILIKLSTCQIRGTVTPGRQKSEVRGFSPRPMPLSPPAKQTPPLKQSPTYLSRSEVNWTEPSLY